MLDRLAPPPPEPLTVVLRYLCKDDPIPPPETIVGIDGRLIRYIHEVATWER
jgi:hypothetical protein